MKFQPTECCIFESKTYANIQEFNVVDVLTGTNMWLDFSTAFSSDAQYR